MIFLLVLKLRRWFFKLYRIEIYNCAKKFANVSFYWALFNFITGIIHILEINIVYKKTKIKLLY